MRSEKKDKKAKEAFDKLTVASVAKEMAQPRVTRSVQVEADERSKPRHGKTARHHAGGIAKAHIEQYGTGTPAVKNKS